MELINVVKYEDRGLLRERIEYINDEGRPCVADTHCCMTGERLAEGYMSCIRHCIEHGHYSIKANTKILQLSRSHIDSEVPQKNFITQRQFDNWLRNASVFPHTQDYVKATTV